MTSKLQHETEAQNREADVFVLPVTPNQRRYWSLDQLRPGNPALNMPLAWRCGGALNQGVVAEALTELVARHETLRTTFDVVDGVLSQIIHPPCAVALPLEDLESLPESDRQEAADEIIRQEARIAMDLKQGRLFFARLIRLAVDHHILLVTMHHSICDGWSNGVVLRDFAAIYDALVAGVSPNLPELPIQYGDYAVWLEEWRQGSGAVASIEYWKRTLGGSFTPLKLPRTASHDSNAEGQIETLLLSPELAKTARDYCSRENVTMYILLFSIFSVFLHRLADSSDFLIGSPCANRHPEAEDLIGSFANPQVMRARVERGDSFRDVLAKVVEWTQGALANQDLPFEDLIEDPHFVARENHIELQVYFLYQRAFMQEQSAGGLRIVPIRSVSPGAMFDLMLSVVERKEGPRLQLEYNPRNYSKETIENYLRGYVALLEKAITDPACSVDALQLPELFADDDKAAVSLALKPVWNAAGITTVLSTHTSVRDVVVTRASDATGRERFRAYIELNAAGGASPITPDQLVTWSASRLGGSPSSLVVAVVDKLPRLANGLIDPVKLEALDDSENAASRQFIEPRDDIERRLLHVWKSVLGLDRISVRADFFDLGGTSLLILRLIARVNAEFQSLLPIPTIYTARTIEKMAELLRKPEEKQFVLALQPSGSKPPLFMIQSYHLYRALPAAMGTDQPFYGVRELELEDRGFPYTLDDLAKRYVQHMREVQPTGPYYLAGFCFFAVLAFAVASELEAQGETVSFLGLIDANCPYYWRKSTQPRSPAKRYGKVLSYHFKKMHDLPLTLKIQYFTRFFARKSWNQLLNVSLNVRYRLYGHYMGNGLRLPRWLHDKVMVTRMAARRHKAQPIHANIHLFPAQDQAFPNGYDPSLGWAEMTSGAVKTVWLPGNHEDMFLDKNLDVMAEKMMAEMNAIMHDQTDAAGTTIASRVGSIG
ncbi:condensation domain-containing protein [Acidicapsa dinghuensis]|uniref:Condensation domain-containing protein n=1 Tax=Acidicapsa dinghuensis TaxID=2218256 RepID=A0ABW1EFW8_9BACT|nr:condensation domain-containing protein [Acidicapsa dinghuensis]